MYEIDSCMVQIDLAEIGVLIKQAALQGMNHGNVSWFWTVRFRGMCQKMWSMLSWPQPQKINTVDSTDVDGWFAAM